MPAMAWYEFKVTGLLKGTKSENDAEIQKFLAIFPEVRPDDPVFDPGKTGSEKEGWPKGLLLKNYKTAIWYCGAEQLDTAFMGSIRGASVVTQLTFHVQLIGTYPGSIFSNKEAMLPEVTWYYYYCSYE